MENEQLTTNPISTATSSDVLRMRCCQLTQQAVHDYMDDFVDYAQRFLADPEVRDAASQSLPFDGGIEGCVRFINGGCIVKEMGIHLMRMDLEPEIYSMGVVLILDECQFSEEKKYVAYISACLTIEGNLSLVNEPKFREDAEAIFRSRIEEYFYPKA